MTLQATSTRSVAALKVGVIGGGASALAAARVFARNGMAPVVLEKDASIGGVWRHVKQKEEEGSNHNQVKKSRPMYAGLRTNLPKEVMQYREKPWVLDGSDKSYMTHEQVLQYLRDYMNEFDLEKYISYNSKVTQLTMLTGNESDIGSNGSTNSKLNDNDDDWPRIRLEWESEIGTTFAETFDAVCVCNGHYSKTLSPRIDGMDAFVKDGGGRVLHSVEYDDPTDFAHQTVLCIGARASGSDLAREIAQHAKHVYLSDSTADKSQTNGRVTVVPRTMAMRADGSTHRVQFANGCTLCPSVDVVIFCSGYDYSFPFINDKSNLDLVVGQRRVMPLYQQLWHAEYPSLTFLGLPHSVVPFPMFELQAEAVVAQLLDRTVSSSLPPSSVRMAEARLDATRGGPKKSGRVEDTHCLGDSQWDYCRTLAKMARIYSEDLENYIATSEAIYKHASRERGSLFPGGSDAYRSTCYARDNGNHSFQVTSSEMEDARSM